MNVALLGARIRHSPAVTLLLQPHSVILARVHSVLPPRLLPKTLRIISGLGVNIGFEQDGTGKEFSRPVLILKGFSRHVCLVVPLTTSTKENPYYLSVGTIDGKNARVIISQIRLIDTRRLDQHITFIDKKLFETIRKPSKTCYDGFPYFYSPP